MTLVSTVVSALAPPDEAEATSALANRAVRWTRSAWLTTATSGFGAALLIGALVLHDPHATGSWGTCPVLALTGHYCPGCGSLRALHDLAVGHAGAAIGHNLLVVPGLIWLGWWWLARVAAALDRPLREPPSSQRFCRGLLVVLALFVVLRNMPGSPLAP